MRGDEDGEMMGESAGIRRTVQRLSTLTEFQEELRSPTVEDVEADGAGHKVSADPPQATRHVAFLRAPSGSGRSVVMELVRRRQSDVLHAVGEPWAREHPLALLEQLLPDSDLGGYVDRPSDRAELDQFQQGIARRLVRRCHAARSVHYMLVDDVHHADLASMQVLMHVARRLRHEPVVMVFSCPDEASDSLHPEVKHFLADPRHLQVDIEPLEPAEILAIARRIGISGMEPHAAVTLRRLCGGHVGPVVETLRSLPEQRWPMDPAMVPVPTSWSRRICDLVDSLTPMVRDSLEDLAIAELAAEWAAQPRWSGPAIRPEAVDEGVRLGLLTEAGEVAHVPVRFRDPAIGRTLRQRMLPSRRRELHRAAAERCQDMSLRLWHLAKSTSGTDDRLAAELRTAAETASRAGRWKEVASLLFSAVDISRSGVEREGALVQGVDALASAGDIVGVMRWLPAVEQIPPSPARDLALANVALHRGRAYETQDLLARAEREVADDLPLRRQLALRRTLDSLLRWDGPALVSWADLAMELSRPEQSTYVESQAIRGVGLAAQGRADAAEADILDASFGNSAGAQTQRFHLSAGWVAMLSGRYRTAVRELEAAVPTRYRGGSLRISLWARGWLARVQFELGDWDEAVRTAEEGLRRAEQVGMTLIAPLLAWTAGEIRILRGQPPPSMSWPEAGMVEMNDYLSMQVPARLLRALHADVRGDRDTRQSLLAPLREIDPWTVSRKPFWLWQPQLVEALLAGDRIREAEELLAELEALSSQSGPEVRAQVRASSALAAVARGDHERAEKDFRAALMLLTDKQRPSFRARVRLDFGRSLRRAGRRRDAFEQLHAAADFYALVGAKVLLDQCAQELRATGMGQSSPTLSFEDGVSGSDSSHVRLTPQEKSVADLVVRGQTNRETARLLFIAEKTVQYHLTRIYAKLGIRSRTELAAVYRHDEG